MLKKLALLAMAVGAIVAFAAPASALASISANAEPEEMYTAESTNLVTESPTAKLECDTVTIEGELGEDTSEVEEIPGTSPTTTAVGGGGMENDCATTIPGVTVMIDATVSNLKFTPTVIDGTATFTATFTNPETKIVAVCHYHGDITLGYNHGGATVATVTGTEQLTQLAEGTCPNAKGTKASMSGSFAITKETGGEGPALEITTP